jgi:uncharacterized protein YndB with AHSA1/START domain
MPANTANLLARSSITIAAPVEKVWDALVTPAAIKQYMFGTTVVSNWKEGSPITWKGEWEGKAYEDRGEIRQFKPGRTLQYTHSSSGAEAAGRPDQAHLVTIQLAREGNGTRVSLTQDNNRTEESRAHSEKNWNMMLDGLKKVVEGR